MSLSPLLEVLVRICSTCVSRRSTSRIHVCICMLCPYIMCLICSNSFLVSALSWVSFWSCWSLEEASGGARMNYCAYGCDYRAPASAPPADVWSFVFSSWLRRSNSNLSLACSFSARSAQSYAFYTRLPIRLILDSTSETTSLLSSSISSATASAMVPIACRRTAHWLSIPSTFWPSRSALSVCSGAACLPWLC